MSILLQDIRYALRSVLRQRGFATVAILTLALGIGANAAIFSLLNPLIFRPLPVPDPERLARVFSGRSEGRAYGRMSYPNYTDLRDHVQSFGSLAASSWPIPFNMTLSNVPGRPGAKRGRVGCGRIRELLHDIGCPRRSGRTFVPEEDSVPDARPVMIVSHRLWQTKLAGEPASHRSDAAPQ